MEHLPTTLNETELQALTEAKNLLENPGVAIKLSNLIGNPIQKGLDMLPENWNNTLSEITNSSLLKAANVAIFTMKDVTGNSSKNFLHKIAVGATGGIGGLFGIAGLAVELPITTTIILRSIADIARSNGESINDIDTKLACLEVFALGGNSVEDDNSESGYYVIRSVLSNSMTQVGKYVTDQGIIIEGAPVFLNIIGKIAKRFGVQVTEKTLAQSVPVIGAAGGALINTLFISHFQDMAKGHFMIRNLERMHGQELIKKLYQEI